MYILSHLHITEAGDWKHDHSVSNMHASAQEYIHSNEKEVTQLRLKGSSKKKN